MTSDNKIMIEIAGEHNHLEDSTQKIERQVLRENCKRKATSSIATLKHAVSLRTSLVAQSNLNQYEYF